MKTFIFEFNSKSCEIIGLLFESDNNDQIAVVLNKRTSQLEAEGFKIIDRCIDVNPFNEKLYGVISFDHDLNLIITQGTVTFIKPS